MDTQEQNNNKSQQEIANNQQKGSLLSIIRTILAQKDNQAPILLDGKQISQQEANDEPKSRAGPDQLSQILTQVQNHMRVQAPSDNDVDCLLAQLEQEKDKQADQEDSVVQLIIMAVNFYRKLDAAGTRLEKKEQEMKEYSQFKQNEIQIMREKLQFLNQKNDLIQYEQTKNNKTLETKIREYQQELQEMQYHKKSKEFKQLEIKNQIDTSVSEAKQQEAIYKRAAEMDQLPVLQEKIQAEAQIQNLKKKMWEIKTSINLQNERIQMLQEDEVRSIELRAGFVFKREEFEEQNELRKSSKQNSEQLEQGSSYHVQSDQEIIFGIIELQNIDFQSNLAKIDKNQIYQKLIKIKQKNILKNLIRELQQYMMGINSDTTDNSMVNSDQLDQLMALIIGNMITNEKAVKILVDFAKVKIDCNLDKNQILDKIEKEDTNFDQKSTDIMINEVFISKIQLQQLDNKIKMISQRINEMKHQKHMLATHVQLVKQTEQQYNKQLLSWQSKLQSSNKTMQIQVQQNMENQKLILNNENGQKLMKSKQAIDNEIHQMDVEIEKNQELLNGLQLKMSNNQNNYNHSSSQLIKSIDEISSKLNYIETHEYQMDKDPAMIAFKNQIQNQKCDRDQLSNLLTYTKKKIAAIFQRQVKKEIKLDSSTKLKLIKIQNLRQNIGRSMNSCIYGHTQSSRINNIQHQSQNLIHGKILSPSSRKKSQSRMKNISLDEDKLLEYQDPSACHHFSQNSHVQSLDEFIQYEYQILHNSPKNQLSEEFNSFKRKYFDTKKTKNSGTMNSYRDSNNKSLQKLLSQKESRNANQQQSKTSQNGKIIPVKQQLKTMNKHNPQFKSQQSIQTIPSTQILKIQSSKKLITPHHALKNTPVQDNDQIGGNPTSDFNQNQKDQIILRASDPASMSQITQFQVPKSLVSVTSSSMSGLPAHIVGDKGGSTYSGGITTGIGGVNTLAGDISTNMMDSEMNTIINTALNSQSSQREKNKNLQKLSMIKYNEKEDELRLSMLGLEISDPNVFGQKKHILAQELESSQIQPTLSSAKISPRENLQDLDKKGMDEFNHISVQKQVRNKSSGSVYNPYNQLNQSNMQDFKSINFNNQQDEQKINLSQIVTDSKRLHDSLNYNEIDITSIDQLQLNERSQNRYEMPTFSSQMKAHSRQIRSSQRVLSQGRASQKSQQSRKSQNSNYNGSMGRAKRFKLVSQKSPPNMTNTTSQEIINISNCQPDLDHSFTLNNPHLKNSNRLDAPKSISHALSQSMIQKQSMQFMNPLSRKIINQLKQKNNFAKNNSMINLNFKRLSQATNIQNVASTQLINKKIRNTNANQMTRSKSNNLKRDINDLQIVYQMSKERVKKLQKNIKLNRSTIGLRTTSSLKNSSKYKKRNLSTSSVLSSGTTNPQKSVLMEAMHRHRKLNRSSVGINIKPFEQHQNIVKQPKILKQTFLADVSWENQLRVHKRKQNASVHSSISRKASKSPRARLATRSPQDNGPRAEKLKPGNLYEKDACREPGQHSNLVTFNTQNSQQSLQKKRKGDMLENMSIYSNMPQSQNSNLVSNLTQLKFTYQPNAQSSSNVQIAGGRTQIDDDYSNIQTHVAQHKTPTARLGGEDACKICRNNYLHSENVSLRGPRSALAKGKHEEQQRSCRQVGHFMELQKSAQPSQVQSLDNETLMNQPSTAQHTQTGIQIVPNISQNIFSSDFKISEQASKYQNNHQDTIAPTASHICQQSHSQTPNDSQQLIVHHQNLSMGEVMPSSSAGPNASANPQAKNESSKAKIKIEFKRYEPALNAIETYVAKIPMKQKNIVEFFTIIKPLVEGCNFEDLNHDQQRMKIELNHKYFETLNTHISGNPPQQLAIGDIRKVEIPKETLERIRQFKENQKNNSNGGKLNFIIKLNNHATFKQDLNLQTQNYKDLKRWVMGINGLIQNQKSLRNLSKMIVKKS